MHSKRSFIIVITPIVVKSMSTEQKSEIHDMVLLVTCAMTIHTYGAIAKTWRYLRLVSGIIYAKSDLEKQFFSGKAYK